MTEEKPVPPDSRVLPVDGEPAPLPGDQSGEFLAHEPPADLPPISLLASGSNDDSFIAPPPPPGQRPARAEAAPGPFATPNSDGSTTLPIMTDIEASAPILTSTSGASFPAINFDAPPAADRSSTARVDEGRPAAGWEDDEEEVEVIEERRAPWSTVLLASYASAITLALGWTLMRGRPVERPGAVAVPSAIAPPESARESSLSRKVEPPEPIVGDHLATIGKPLRVGSLEVTPVQVRRESVVLQRANAYTTPQRRDGGKQAMVLTLKLRNTSTDIVFAPLDRAYVRERGKGIVDTYVETASGERIYPYRLALDSEWSIVGQDFTELRPGESRTVAIVSAPDAPPDLAAPFNWRVRLRTGINRTDVIGVRWPKDPSRTE